MFDSVKPKPVSFPIVASTFLLSCLTATAQTDQPEIEIASTAPISTEGFRPEALTYLDALILGTVEGLTEFLPVSSTGHLIIATHVLELEVQVPVDARTIPAATEIPRQPDGPSAVDSYIIIIQFGAILAVALIYWPDLRNIGRGVAGKNRSGQLLGRNLLIAFIPAVVIGLSLGNFVEKHLFSYRAVTLALVTGGILMLAVERARAKGWSVAAALGPEDLHRMSMGQSLIVGLFQCVALWPGTSRSMMAIVGGYVVGLSPPAAAKFSFLLGLPTLGGAAIYKCFRTGPDLLDSFGWPPLLLGGLAAAVAAGVSVRWMVDYLTKHGLALFAWYRIVLAIVLVLFLF